MRSIIWKDNRLLLLDQRLLPHQEVWVEIHNHMQAADAIENMIVRGAPAIAIVGAYGLLLAQRNGVSRSEASAILLNSRPTAVNLEWALNRLSHIPDAELEEAVLRIHKEDLQINLDLAQHGAPLLKGGVLTICNTGALATSGHGTALGMIRTAHSNGQNIHVYALETRPYLQGARLTAFECQKEGIPCTLITDGMAGALLASGRVTAAVAGCDRVALNGDTANKIGTYSLAVLCRHHHIPLYIAMPTTTLDRSCPNGTHIPIEERSPVEIRSVQGHPIAPDDIDVWNPSFDVTPAQLIEAWVTELGIWRLPFPQS